MSITNIRARQFQQKTNIIPFPAKINPQLQIVQEIFNLPVCSAVKNCFSSKKDNPFNCPNNFQCRKYKAILTYFV